MSRPALISSAVSFLRDPATANSPLAQRVAFLESKGLTPPEIENALASAAHHPSYPPSQQLRGIPREFERDWRDWFIMSVIGGTVAYLAVGLAKRYIIPHLQSPDQTQLAASQSALEAKYDQASALLLELQTSTDTLVTSLEDQKVQLDQELIHLRTAVDESREAERKREIWAKGVTEKVDQVVQGLPKMLEKQSTMQSQSLVDLSTELKSLKSLLLTRRPTTTAPLPTAPIPTLPTSYSTSALPTTPVASALPTSATTSDLSSTAAAAATPTTTTTTQPPAPTRVSSFGVRPVGIPAWQLKGNGAGLAASNSNVVVPPSNPTPIPIVAPATTLSAATTSFTPAAVPTNGDEVAATITSEDK